MNKAGDRGLENRLWGIYHVDRKYARVMGEPLRTVVEGSAASCDTWPSAPPRSLTKSASLGATRVLLSKGVVMSIKILAPLALASSLLPVVGCQPAAASRTEMREALA